MGDRGPIPKRSDQRRRRNKLVEPVEIVFVRVCRRVGCRCVVGNVYYDPDGRWCVAGHAQREDGNVGRRSSHPWASS